MKRWLGRLRPLTAVLMLVNVAASALLVANAVHGPPPLESRASPELAGAPSGELPFPTTHLDANVIQDQALLHATRAFYRAPPPAVVQAPTPRPNYRLTGTIEIPGKPTAALLVDNATGASLKVTVGDSVAGWSVQAVESKRVILRSDQETMEIVPTRAKQPGRLLVGSAADNSLRPNRPPTR